MNASDPADENTSIGRGPTIRREMSAGLTTFLTMAYIVFVQPVSCCYAPVSAGDSQVGRVKVSNSYDVPFFGVPLEFSMRIQDCIGTETRINIYIEGSL